MRGFHENKSGSRWTKRRRSTATSCSPKHRRDLRPWSHFSWAPSPASNFGRASLSPTSQFFRWSYCNHPSFQQFPRRRTETFRILSRVRRPDSNFSLKVFYRDTHRTWRSGRRDLNCFSLIWVPYPKTFPRNSPALFALDGEIHYRRNICEGKKMPVQQVLDFILLVCAAIGEFFS